MHFGCLKLGAGYRHGRRAPKDNEDSEDDEDNDDLEDGARRVASLKIAAKLLTSIIALRCLFAFGAVLIVLKVVTVLIVLMELGALHRPP